MVGQGLFADCVRLKELKLPSTTKVIEAEALRGCTSLRELHLPGTITQIEPSSDCSSLEVIDIGGNNTHYQSVDGVLLDKDIKTLIWFPQGRTADYLVPGSVTTIETGAFRGSQCRHITLGKQITEIGAGVFAGSQIESMAIPDGVETIRSGLFQNCGKLLTLTLGTEALFLSSYLFEGCPLTELHLKSADFIPHCESDTFAGAEQLFKECTLYVPKGTKRRYQNAASWSRFERVVEE
jgi:hypothetical protein